MKKFLCLALGVSVLSAAMIPFSAASRNAYHAYITSQENYKKYRYYTNRLGDRKRRFQNRVERKNQQEARQLHLRRDSRANQQNRNVYVEATRGIDLDRTRRPLRTFTTSLRAPWRQPLNRTGIVSEVSTLPSPLVKAFETYRNDAFSLEIPVAARPTADNNHLFTAFDGELSIRIEKFENNCSGTYGFQGCATQIAKGQNYAVIKGDGKLLSLDRVKRNYTKSDTVLDVPNRQTPVYTEQFSALFPDGVEYTLSRYIVKDYDGEGVYFIEVKIPREKARNYVGVAKRLFDSFRIYQDALPVVEEAEEATTEETQ